MFYNPHKKVALFFLISSLILFSLATVFLLTRQAKLTIVVIPKEEEVFLEKTIKIPEDLKGEIFEISLEKELISSPKASLEIESVARGEVEIVNNSNGGQNLVRMTRLLSAEGILFRLDHQVFAPAKGKVKANVYADKSGREGEIGPTRFTVPGLSPALQKLIYAQNSEKMKGGVKKIGLITEKDINEAKSLLNENLTKEIENKIQETLKEKLGEIIGWKIILGDKFSEIKSGAKPNEERGEFKTTGKMVVGLVAIKEKELLNLTKDLLEKNIPLDKKLKKIEEKTLKYELGKFSAKEKKAEIEIKIKGKTIIRENSSIFDFEKIKGLDKNFIKKYFEQFKEIDSAEIKFYPFWKKKAPLDLTKEFVRIKIKESN